MATKWNFFQNKVQKGMPHGQFLSGRATIIGAGPPNLMAFGSANARSGDGDVVFLIGLSQSLSISQSLNVQRFFEIGSVRQYFITGHNITMISVGRVLYHGPNILRALYAYYSSNNNNGLVIKSLLDRYGEMPIGVNHHTVQISPGDNNLFINMTSDLFSQPVGLLLILKDQNELTYGLAYAENCYVDQHTLGTDSTSIIMSESCNIQCERILPIGSGTVDLVATLDESLMRNIADGDQLTPASSA